MSSAEACMRRDPIEVRNVKKTVAGERAPSLHEQLVAYTDSICGSLEARSDVWDEHSYARGRVVSGAVRVLLAPPAPPDGPLDVVAPPRAPPALPPALQRAASPASPASPAPPADQLDGDWVERVLALAPSGAHARLAAGAVRVLHEARLARLAGEGAGAAEEARGTARRLRVLLAPLWVWAGPPAQRPPAWLHAQLATHLPPAYRALYDDALAEMRRAVPRLVDRLTAAHLPPPAVDPLAPPDDEEMVGPEAAGPWLAWVRCGCGRGEARWERRLGALLHVRVLAPPPCPAPQPPDRWAAAVLHHAKQTLADIIDEAKGRAVVVGGAGAGAGGAAALAAGGARVAALLLVAPGLLTAEGPRTLPDDVLHEVEVPTLVVAGGRGAGALAEGGAGGAGGRRVLALAGADDALRLPRRTRRRLRLPQAALDAALAEEMARWIQDAVDAEPDGDGDEYTLLPAAHAAPAPGGGRGIEVVEGRVVARVSGSTPLLLTPRRAGGGALAAADILQLPIVFADDEPPGLALPETTPVAEKPVTVTSGNPRGGGMRFTRVIVAKRGPGGARAGPGGARPGPGGARAGPGGARAGPGGVRAGPGRGPAVSRRVRSARVSP